MYKKILFIILIICVYQTYAQSPDFKIIYETKKNIETVNIYSYKIITKVVSDNNLKITEIKDFKKKQLLNITKIENNEITDSGSFKFYKKLYQYNIDYDKLQKQPYSTMQNKKQLLKFAKTFDKNRYNIKYTNETKQIKGYLCSKVEYTINSEIYAIWLAKLDILSKYPDTNFLTKFKNLDGLIFQIYKDDLLIKDLISIE